MPSNRASYSCVCPGFAPSRLRCGGARRRRPIWISLPTRVRGVDLSKLSQPPGCHRGRRSAKGPDLRSASFDPSISPDGKVHVGHQLGPTGTLYALDGRTLALKWTFPPTISGPLDFPGVLSQRRQSARTAGSFSPHLPDRKGGSIRSIKATVTKIGSSILVALFPARQPSVETTPFTSRRWEGCSRCITGPGNRANRHSAPAADRFS
jgi:hypothetical protein